MDLIIVSGLPGAGKSTLSTSLARELQYPLLCIDDFIGDVPENADFSFWDSRIAMLMDVIETQLKIGLNVIVDSVFMNMDRHHAQALARKHKARFIPIHVYMSDEKLWERRMTARHEEIPEAATWDSIQHQRTHFREWEPEAALFIDSVNALDTNLANVLAFLSQPEMNLKPLEELPLVPGRYH